MYYIDPLRSGIENLLQAINYTYNKDYTHDDLEFDLPIADSSRSGYNTKVLIKGKTLFGSKFYWYNRKSLEDISNLISTPNVNIAGAFSLREIRRRIATSTGLGLLDIDLELSKIPTVNDGQSITATIKATPNSFIYTGSMEVALTTQDTIGINDDPFLDGWELDRNYSYGVAVDERRITGSLTGDSGYINPIPAILILDSTFVLR